MFKRCVVFFWLAYSVFGPLTVAANPITDKYQELKQSAVDAKQSYEDAKKSIDEAKQEIKSAKDWWERIKLKVKLFFPRASCVTLAAAISFCFSPKNFKPIVICTWFFIIVWYFLEMVGS